MKTIKGLLHSLLLASLVVSLSACKEEVASESTSVAQKVASQASPLCMPVEAAVYALDSSEIAMSGQGEIRGHVMLGHYSLLSMSGKADISGDVYHGSPYDLKQSGQARVHGQSFVSNWDLENFVKRLTERLALIPASEKISTIDNSMTIRGNGHLNVIEVCGDLKLSGQDVLTLLGSEDDAFIFNIQGEVSLTGQAQILLAGGVKAENVIFHNLGKGKGLNLSGQGQLNGSFLSFDREIKISGQGEINGAVVGRTKIQISGQGLVIRQRTFCVTPEPEPTTTTTQPETTTTTLAPTTTTTTTQPAPTTTTTSTTTTTQPEVTTTTQPVTTTTQIDFPEPEF